MAATSSHPPIRARLGLLPRCVRARMCAWTRVLARVYACVSMCVSGRVNRWVARVVCDEPSCGQRLAASDSPRPATRRVGCAPRRAPRGSVQTWSALRGSPTRGSALWSFREASWSAAAPRGSAPEPGRYIRAPEPGRYIRAPELATRAPTRVSFRVVAYF